MYKKSILASIKALAIFTITLGILYPLIIFSIGQIFFHDKVNGSLYVANNQVRGSFLIGQKFTSGKYFWSRPSAIDYNPMPSGGSNLSLTSRQLLNQYEQNRKNFIAANYLTAADTLPQEMLFASASGVDSYISKRAALMQIERVSKARKFDKLHHDKLIQLVDSLAEYPQFGIFGCEVVNVLKLNINLDKLENTNE
jgi:K+-transporting ATPase ATPase C chain